MSSKKSRRRRAEATPPPSIGKRLRNWILRLLARAARAVLRFLWEQVKWAAALGAVGVAAYVLYHAGFPWWISSALMFIGVCIAFAWALRLLSMLFGGGDGDDYYRDKPKNRESWREREERDWQEMHDANQREEEDRQ